MYDHFTSYDREKQLASLIASKSVKFDIPTIDKITLLADFRYYEKNLLQLSMHNDFIDTVPDYSMHYPQRIRTASDLFIQLSPPHNTKIPNVRIEFNPNKFDHTGSLWHAIYPMLKNKRLSRIDYAIDYQQDLSAWSHTTIMTRKTIRYSSPDGKLETLYLGVRTSGKQYRIYNKALESNLPGIHWRIEQQLTLGPSDHFLQLQPFADLTIWQPDSFTGDYIDDTILGSLHADPQNWSRLPPARYRYYRKLIKDITRVVHLPLTPVTTFQRGFPPLKAFLTELLT